MKKKTLSEQFQHKISKSYKRTKSIQITHDRSLSCISTDTLVTLDVIINKLST
jgi:hypothetical protein